MERSRTVSIVGVAQDVIAGNAIQLSCPPGYGGLYSFNFQGGEEMRPLDCLYHVRVSPERRTVCKHTC